MVIGKRGNKPFEDQRYFLRSEAEVEIFLMIGNERRSVSEYPGKTHEEIVGYIQEYSDVLLHEDLSYLRTSIEMAKEEVYIRKNYGSFEEPNWNEIQHDFASFFGEKEAEKTIEEKKKKFEKYGCINLTHRKKG